MQTKRAALDRLPKTAFFLEGTVGAYLKAISENWLKIIPYSNPGMLEMLRDRERKPYRNLLRWAGWFAGMNLVSTVQVLRVTGEPELKEHTKWLYR